VRAFIAALVEEGLKAALGRGRHERVASSSGRRHGHRPRRLVTTFGALTLSVPRAGSPTRLASGNGTARRCRPYRRPSRRAELPCAETASLGTDHLRRVDGRQTLQRSPVAIDLAA